MQLKICEVNHFVHVFDLGEKCAPLDSHLRHYPRCFGINPELSERAPMSASSVLDSQRRRVEFKSDLYLVVCSPSFLICSLPFSTIKVPTSIAGHPGFTIALCVNPELSERTPGSASSVLDSQRRRVEFKND